MNFELTLTPPSLMSPKDDKLDDDRDWDEVKQSDLVLSSEIINYNENTNVQNNHLTCCISPSSFIGVYSGGIAENEMLIDT